MRTDESVIIYTQRPGLPLDTSEYISLVRLCRFVAKGMGWLCRSLEQYEGLVRAFERPVFQGLAKSPYDFFLNLMM